jgi:HTH-type transcriptional regulator/antitoxin HigA
VTIGSLTRDDITEVLMDGKGRRMGGATDHGTTTISDRFRKRSIHPRLPPPAAVASTPIDVLRYAIEELGHTQAELAKIIGSRARASEILARRRPLTLHMIQKISAAWKISADLLVRPYRTTASAA